MQISTKSALAKKLALGLSGIASAAILTAGGVAGATPSHHHMPKPHPTHPTHPVHPPHPPKPSHGHGNGHHGYGGVSANPQVHIHDNHGVINVIINYFFG